MKIRKSGPLRGEIPVPGDKSISHRAVMLGAIANGQTRITHFLKGADCLSTIDCFRRMGIRIEETPDEIVVYGNGLHGLRAPAGELDAGNSGTTMRLLSGLLAGQGFPSVLTGDSSLRQRPMARVITPLKSMGADIRAAGENHCAPLLINQSDPGHHTRASLSGISYQSPVASAQVKSCVLLAGLYANGQTSVTEPARSRDHTERMLSAFGARVSFSGTSATVEPEPQLQGMDVEVPGDISSAAYFAAAATLVPFSEVLIRNVGINPTRDGFLRVCRMMGADITLLEERLCCGEPAADLLVRSAQLHGCTIEGDLIPTLIDELPVIAVMAAFADGTTTIRDAAELKVKESDRIAVMTDNLQRMGVQVTATDDGMTITGGATPHGAIIDSHLDHRIAMSFAIAALAAEGETQIRDADCVRISYPDFYRDLDSVKKDNSL